MRMRQSYTGFAASAILAVTAGAISSADCDSAQIIFASQADVDAANCTRVNGDVIIPTTATGNITLNNNLLSIKGSLLVQSCDESDASCSKITGLSSYNLTTIEGRLEISNVPSLLSVTLPGLRKVGGEVELVDLPALNLLNLGGINSVGSFHLISAQNLRRATIGVYGGASADPNIGLKNITGNLTGAAEAVVEVRDVGLENLNGLMDFWDARRLSIENMPNLQRQMIRVRNVDEVRIIGNGNLTIWFWEEGLTYGTPGPNIDRLVVSGVRHVSPCLHPVVREFVAFNNTGMEYLHFNFDELERIEVRDNPRLKKMVSWAGLNRFWRDIFIHDNPNLALSQFPKREPDDNLTAYDCPDLYASLRDQWAWFPSTFNSVVIAADVDNTFFNETFTSLYLNNSDAEDLKPKVLHRFEVNSTNSTFDCTALNILRTKKGAFPGNYSCQGQTLPAGQGIPSLEGPMRMALGAAMLAALLLY